MLKISTQFQVHNVGNLSNNCDFGLQVNPESKASLAGIREGDIVTSINGQTTRGLTNAEAHCLLKNGGETLQLGLNE